MERLNFFWSLPRYQKRILSLVIDFALICFSFYLSLLIRLGEIDVAISTEATYTLGATILMTLIAFAKLGLYRAVLRYLTFHALTVILVGAGFSSLCLFLSSYLFDAQLPRTLPVIYFTFLSILCGATRLTARSLIVSSNKKGCESVLIYGAGTTGRQLAIALRNSESYQVRGFIDDDPYKKKSIIQGVTVYSGRNIESLVKKMGIKKILLAIPQSSRTQRKSIIDSLIHLPLEVLTVPNFKDIVEGNAKVDELKDVPIEDLLGREPVDPNKKLMAANIQNQVVMVTGAGGSIGSELCRQIVRQKPKKLILFEVSEYALYQIDKELGKLIVDGSLDVSVIPLLGSVQRINRLVATMKSFKVDTVYHAAAYKHVPLVEYNVVEGIRNNVFGTYYCARAAIEAKVSSFVLISTDKAVRPTNIMGTSKRMAELALQSLADGAVGQQTCFSMVRFGNVLGSSGSVIPLFKKQIAEGNTVTVTHPEIIRYFMTIPEAAQLVIQAGAMAKGGDVFVLDMGEPVKILDLAKKLIRLSGLEVKSPSNESGDISIEFTGLRPGEKLFEELLIGDDVKSTSHDRIMTANEKFMKRADFESLLEELDDACHNFEHEKIRNLLLQAPTGFNPTDGIGDLVWNESHGLEENLKLESSFSKYSRATRFKEVSI
ncbi:nucleoside-diphosphate sugar epimerase/dehydratase [Ferrimonas sp. YFM]|uniref:polysaccharide biosynthesis protein n=1 Tax=Ferrimonas sp. YFM TaxID=3028878 RepID=UPI002573E5AF|nr:nucleoside-diphosphate sugar epimerase/dehydratase [Ferrimonas sp. YFM]BDY04082.1 nucleoside-diphosphate sugar epimerase [Ferrimonas sp. YFM]